MSELSDQKAALRLRLRQALGAMSDVARASASARLCANLVSAAFWQSAGSVLAFMPTRTEPDIREAIRAALASGRTLCLPRFDAETGLYQACTVADPERDLRPGPFGILEPGPERPLLDVKRLDLLLVPGLGFSLSGGRLGRGKGHYDRLLAAIPGCKCGVAFEQQVIPVLPVESHDVRLDHLVTPSRCLAVAPNPPPSA